VTKDWVPTPGRACVGVSGGSECPLNTGVGGNSWGPGVGSVVMGVEDRTGVWGSSGSNNLTIRGRVVLESGVTVCGRIKSMRPSRGRLQYVPSPSPVSDLPTPSRAKRRSSSSPSGAPTPDVSASSLDCPSAFHTLTYRWTLGTSVRVVLDSSDSAGTD